MKVAALDLGSNTFLMLIAEIKEGRITQVLRDELEVTRLGQGVHSQREFHPEALKRARNCLTQYREILNQEPVDKIVAVATSAARDVRNREDFFQIGRDLNIPIQVISGDYEAKLTFDGSTFDLPKTENVAVVDVGGGSTEIIAKAQDHKLTGASLDIGSVRLTEHLVSAHPVPAIDLQRVKEYIDGEFKRTAAKLPKDCRELVAVAGTPTTLAAVDQSKPYSDELVHGYYLQSDRLEKWITDLASMDLETRKSLTGMDPRRADVIVVGAMILMAALDFFGLDQMRVSTKGVRYGAALNWQSLSS